MAEFPLGGKTKNYDSKKGRETLVNLIAELNQDGSFKTVRRTEGLTQFATLPLGPVRSDLLVNDNLIYVVSGTTLFRVDSLGVVETLGVVGGSGRAKLSANSLPSDTEPLTTDSQILILNGSGVGFIFRNSTGLVPITDPDFFPSTSVTISNERFYLTKDGSNIFFASELSDGLSYSPLSFDSAQDSPDNVIALVAKRSSVWVIGTETSQYYQFFNDDIFPLRTVKGATKEWGIIAPDSLADVNDFFAFLADDRTVRMVNGTQMIKISDHEFNLKVKGNGTATYPGFETVDDAIGFFVDGPVHSIYFITFPSEGYTWGYDVNTGLSHLRESEGLGFWRVNGATKFGSKIICGDSQTGTLWTLDPNNKTEDGNILRTRLTTPSISNDQDVTIPLIEIDMEVGTVEDPTLDPKMIVSYTKDGGYTYTNKGHVSLGRIGDYRTRVPLRRFGRLVRNKDFAIRMEVTDPVAVQYYAANFFPEVGM